MSTTITDLDHHQSPGAIVETIQQGFGSFTRKKATVLMAVALFDALKLATRYGSPSTALWMVRTLSLSNSTAHEYVKVARAMLEFNLMSSAFLEGRISYSKVRLILPHMTAENEAELVELAASMTYHELELALLRYRKSGEGLARKSYVRLKARSDGRIGMWANFNAAEGARVMAAMKVGELAFHDVDWDALRDPSGQIDKGKLDAEIDERTAGCSGFGLPLGEAEA